LGKKVKDPGFGASSNEEARRMINNDGTFNIKPILS